MASGPELLGRLGLDKSNYTRGLGEAERDFSKFTSSTTGQSRRLGGEFAHTFRGMREIIHGFGAVLVFDRIINEFKSLSEWANKFGDQTDENIRAAGRWGSAWSSATESFKAAASSALGVLVRAGEYVGGLIKGETLDQTDALAASEDAAKAAEARRDKMFKENNPEKVKNLRTENARMEEQLEEKSMTLVERKKRIEQEISTISMAAANGDQKAIQKQEEMRNQILKLELERRSVVEEIARQEQAASRKALDDAAEELSTRIIGEQRLRAEKEKTVLRIKEIEASMEAKKADKAKLTLGELANLDIYQSGVSVAAGEQGSQARTALDLEKKANQARLSGDIPGAEEFASQAARITDALHGPGGLLKSTDHPTEDMNAQLEAANKTLDDISKKLDGRFAAEA